MPGFLPKLPMTMQEYEAKAMLLGYQYSDITHLFYDEGARNCYDPDTVQRLWSLSDEVEFAIVPPKFKDMTEERTEKYKIYLRR